MSRRPKKYVPKQFESSSPQFDTSANIYMSMLMSAAWQSLNAGAKMLYMYCKAQYYGEKRKPKPDFRQLTEQEQQQCFTMNKSKWKDLYHIYTNDRQFYKDMSLLIKSGFIELIESGKNTRTKNIYMLSDKWKTSMMSLVNKKQPPPSPKRNDYNYDTID